MIEEILWPFTLKVFAKRLNKLQINSLGQSPKSIMHGIKLEDILVKKIIPFSAQYTYSTVDCKAQEDLAHQNRNLAHVLACILDILHFTQTAWH